MCSKCEWESLSTPTIRDQKIINSIRPNYSTVHTVPDTGTVWYDILTCCDWQYSRYSSCNLGSWNCQYTSHCQWPHWTTWWHLHLEGTSRNIRGSHVLGSTLGDAQFVSNRFTRLLNTVTHPIDCQSHVVLHVYAIPEAWLPPSCEWKNPCASIIFMQIAWKPAIDSCTGYGDFLLCRALHSVSCTFINGLRSKMVPSHMGTYPWQDWFPSGVYLACPSDNKNIMFIVLNNMGVWQSDLHIVLIAWAFFVGIESFSFWWVLCLFTAQLKVPHYWPNPLIFQLF